MELLAVIVIIGILAVSSVVAYTKYIDKARNEKEFQNENTIISATKLFLQANKDYMPKIIGESRIIKVSLLKNNNYLKEDIVNKKGESCMEYSYVYVYKNDYNSYTYKPYIYCGSETPNNTTTLDSPVITDFNFSNSSKVKKASFSMKIKGSNSDSTIKIDSYNYTIYVKKTGETKYTEYYSSGSISGKKQTTINVGPIYLKDYIDITGYTSVKVKIFVRNNLGKTAEVTKSTGDNGFIDTTAPNSECNDITGQATSESDWINKGSGRSRVITIKCNDGDGSGCIRDEFIKSWPSENEKSVKTSSIEIEDNTGNKTTCPVLVNVDTIAPTIKITAISKKSKSSLLTERTATDGEAITINPTDFKGTNNTNGWINKSMAEEGIQFTVTTEDDMYLYNYTWETSDTDSSSKQFNKVDSKNEQFTIFLNKEGRRYGRLTVYDRAGNATVINVYANIDYGPKNLKLTMTHSYDSSKPQGSKATVYSNNTWIATNVYMTDARTVPYVGPTADSISGIAKYQISSDNKKWEDYNYDSDQELYRIRTNGTSTRYIKAIDNAGNTASITKTIKIDKEGPKNLTLTMTHSYDSSKPQGSKATVYSNGTKTSNNVYMTDARYYPFVGPSAESLCGIKSYEISDDNKIWTIYKYDSSKELYRLTTNGTHYRYIKATDNLNREITITKKIVISKCSASNPFGCDKYGACRKNGKETGSTTTFDCPPYTSICTNTHGSTDPWWTGTIKHYKGDSYDVVYPVKDSNGNNITNGNWIQVCATGGDLYNDPVDHSYLTNYWNNNKVTVDGKTCYKLWVHKKCIEKNGATCSTSECPG